MLMMHRQRLRRFLSNTCRTATQRENAPPGIGGVRVPPLPSAQQTVCPQRFSRCGRVDVVVRVDRQGCARSAGKTRACFASHTTAFVQPSQAERLARGARGEIWRVDPGF